MGLYRVVEGLPVKLNFKAYFTGLITQSGLFRVWVYWKVGWSLRKIEKNWKQWHVVFDYLVKLNIRQRSSMQHMGSTSLLDSKQWLGYRFHAKIRKMPHSKPINGGFGQLGQQ